MTDKKSLLGKILKERILVLDGAMGTMIQQYELNETDFRGAKFAKHSSDLKGNNDILCLTKPQIISEIHETYLKTGCDIIETNTFNANRISQADYETEEFCYDLNKKAASIAKRACITFSSKEKPRFVAEPWDLQTRLCLFHLKLRIRDIVMLPLMK